MSTEKKANISANNSGEHTVYTVENIFQNISGLPWDDTQTVIEPNDSNGLKDKVIVKYRRLHLDAIYGSKSKKLDIDADARASVEEYLQAFYDAYGEDSKKSDGYETFEQWLHFQTVKRVSTVLLPGICKSMVLSLAKQNIDDTLDNMQAKVDSGEVDADAVARMEAMLAQMKAKVKTSAKAENVA